MKTNKTQTIKIVHELQKEEDRKFFSIVGNPPYQEELNVQGKTSKAIYHHFMNNSKKISQNISLIYPLKYASNAGLGDKLKDFTSSELNSKHYISFYAFSEDYKIFKNVVIRGGVNLFLWNNTPRVTRKMEYYYNDKMSFRETLLDKKKAFIIKNDFYSIVKKINPKNTVKVSANGMYLCRVTSKDIETWDKTGPLKIWVPGGITLPLPKDSTKKYTQDYKVFVSDTTKKSKNTMTRITRIFLGKPGEICSETYEKLGSFRTKQEAINMVRYMKTDLINFLIGILCNTQQAGRKVYALVPDINAQNGEILDKPGSYLDFNTPETLDEQLFKIYKITTDEQKIIRTCIKPWIHKLSYSAKDTK